MHRLRPQLDPWIVLRQGTSGLKPDGDCLRQLQANLDVLSQAFLAPGRDCPHLEHFLASYSHHVLAIFVLGCDCCFPSWLNLFLVLQYWTNRHSIIFLPVLSFSLTVVASFHLFLSHASPLGNRYYSVCDLFASFCSGTLNKSEFSHNEIFLINTEVYDNKLKKKSALLFSSPQLVLSADVLV